MYQELYAAWQQFRRGKKPTASVDAFTYHLEHELRDLADDITTKTYQHGGYHRSIITEKKRRNLAVALVRDRLVHRFVYGKTINLFEAVFDPDVWSCRLGKGLHRCLIRTQALVKRYPHTYVWRMDITKFFDSVDQQTLRRCVYRRVSDSQLRWLCDQIIDSYTRKPGLGIPIGNLTSQLFANVYLNEFDRFVRHQLKPLAYVRYGDDAVLWFPTRHGAYVACARAKQFLSHTLKLMVNPRNDIVVATKLGLHFLGHVITERYVVVDRHTTRSALDKSDWRNISSYKALQLAKGPRRQLDWQLADRISDIDFYIK